MVGIGDSNFSPAAYFGPEVAYKYCPVRICLDATGAGGFGVLTFMAPGEYPLLLRPRSEAEQELHATAPTANEICIFELSAPVDTV